ncbi:thioesterase [Alcanivorax sp. 97CO-5]|jgi:acyl-CoA thioester hydrolase|nr:thioesterase [Alcanivorax sp. 97CO-5]
MGGYGYHGGFFPVLDSAMFEQTITPRFYETDAFGHVNNTVVTGWFETGRAPLFRLFGDAENPASMPLILARVEVDFVAQIYYGSDVILRAAIERIGNSSFVVIQQAWQNGALVARGRAVQVYFDHKTQASAPLPDDLRDALAQHEGELPEN